MSTSRGSFYATNKPAFAIAHSIPDRLTCQYTDRKAINSAFYTAFNRSFRGSHHVAVQRSVTQSVEGAQYSAVGAPHLFPDRNSDSSAADRSHKPAVTSAVAAADHTTKQTADSAAERAADNGAEFAAEL